MITRGEIVSTTLRALRRGGSEEDKKTVESFVNKFYFELCALVSVSALRRRATVDLSSTDYSSGMWLKANMSGLYRVQDVDDGFDYINRDRAVVTPDENAYLFYSYVPSSDPAFVGSDGYLQNNALVFTSDSLTTDYTGDYIKFGSEPGYYLLSAIKTFSPTYWGDNMDSGSFVIRPRGTQKLICLDQDGDEITDRSVYVDYCEYPPPLYLDIDVPLLPSSRALELQVMKEAMIVIGKRQSAGNALDKEIEKAVNELKKLSPPPQAPSVARDRFNKVFSFDSQIFTDR